MEVLLFFVLVVAVAFGTWFFRYGFSLLGGNLEPQVPVAPQDVLQEKSPQAVGTVQIQGAGFDTRSR